MNRLISPSTDFRSVRDGRNSQVFYVDVALDSARSAAAGTGLVLPISGNSFYIDANPTDGNAFVHFQDTNFDRGPVPLYVSPGTIFNIPYTQILLENAAQPGKKIRIAYGIDVDFQPGSVSQIAVTNAGGYTAVRPEAPTSNWVDASTIGANGQVTIFTPASNTNGVILLDAHFNELTASVAANAFIAKNSAPANVNDGRIILPIDGINTSDFVFGSLKTPKLIPAGLGLYYFVVTATTAGRGQRSAEWRKL